MRSLFSADCEISVIGAMLLDADAISAVAEVGLTIASFFDKRHGLVFGAIMALSEASKPVDVVTVSEFLESSGSLAAIGGIAYLGEMADCTPSTNNAEAYARIVADFEHERMWFKTSQAISEVLMSDDGGDHVERLGKIQQVLLGAEKNETSTSVIEMRPALKAYLDVVEDRANNPGIHGLLTGFDHVDHRLAGMQPGDLGIIAGRPAMGKTAYSMNIMKHIAIRQKKNAMVFSLEMPTTQLMQRLVASEGKIKLGLLKSGKVVGLPDQMVKFGAAATRIKDSGGQIFFDDTAGLGISELVARAKRFHRKHELAVILVDHIGLVESSLKTDNETLRLAQVSRLLKKLAKELGCVVIGLAQLNRGVEQRANKRPMISDLRQSGSIEQDADWIQLLYRDEYYNEDSLTPGQVEIISGKIRDGEPGTDYLGWRGEYSLLEGLKEGERYQSHETVEQESYV
jgi:replicative DNA helicase